MGNYLSTDILRNWSREQQEEYRQSLEQRMADLAIFYAQLMEVMGE